MLHSLQPAQFVVSQHLRASAKCPQCDRRFLYGNGAMSLTYYCDAKTEEIRRGLLCFCSTACLLHWEHPTLLGRMH
jgi:hypothetical protein